MTSATQFSCKALFLSWPPVLSAADYHKRAGSQHRRERLQFIPAQIYLDGRFDLAFRCDFSKPPFAEIEYYGRALKWKRKWNNLRN